MASLKQVTSQIEKDEEGVVVAITQRNGQPYLAADGSPSTITVYGSEAPTYKKRRDAFYQELADSAEEADRHANRIALAACTVKAWHGWEGEDGADIPCTVANARGLLSVEHILYQVEKGATQGADFFGASSTGS